MALAIILLTPVVLLRTPVDIFPDINIPVISLVWTYSGLEPQEMEQRITSNVERGVTTLVSDVEHIESQSLSGIAVIKVFFQPGANIQTALAQTAAISQTFLRFLPPGTTPPLVIIYSASTVPVIQIGLTSDTLSEQQLFDFGNYFIRTQLATVPGAATPFPYGGKQRVVSVDINPTSLQAKGLSAVDIVNAVSAQNLILPTGTAKLGTLEYGVEMNGSPQTVEELNDLPIKTVNGATIYMKDVAHVRDGFSPQTNIVLSNGQRGVLMSIYKTGTASTIDIVDKVKQMLDYNKGSVPEGLHISTFFDQSLYVRASIQGVIREAIIAACLTAVMILLFLGNWKSTLIISVSIPLSILVSILCLSALGQTINIMTLGGLALAVGILVDEATVKDRRTSVWDSGRLPPAQCLAGVDRIQIDRWVPRLRRFDWRSRGALREDWLQLGLERLDEVCHLFGGVQREPWHASVPDATDRRQLEPVHPSMADADTLRIERLGDDHITLLLA